MDLRIKWHPPIQLLDGKNQDLIYVADGLDDWKDVSGVYMFARLFNNQLSPLYIGKAKNLGVRISQHFKSNTQLMNHIKSASKGVKVVVMGEFTAKSGQNIDTCIGLIEGALIDHALTEGYELLNVQGTRAATHQVAFSGYLPARNFTGVNLTFPA